MSKELFLLFSFSIIIGITYGENIVLNFKTNINLDSLNENNYMKSTMEQQIYVELNVGGGEQQLIPMTLKTLKYPTFIVSSSVQDGDILIKYDETKSSTFKKLVDEEIKNLFIYDFTQGFYVSDSLELSPSLNYNNFTYILATKMNGLIKNISGEIGLSKKTENKINYKYPQKTNFLQQLIENNIISKNIFGIIYDSEYEGRLILGETLDEVDPKYKETEKILNEIDNDVPSVNKDDWLIKFNINFKKSETEEYTETSYGFLQYEIGLIFGSDNYRNNFIANYFNNKKCVETVIDSTPYSFYQYSCDNEEQFSDFPDLNLYLEEKYNFTFNKNELFKKVGNKYFFQIVFQVSQMNINYWRLGQLFFRKYPTFLSNNGNNSTFLYYLINKEDGDKTDETDSSDTTDGSDETDSSDTTDGSDETDSSDTTDGSDGTDESDKTDGSDGSDGSDEGKRTDESDGSDGGKGTDGHSGTDGNNNDSNGKNTALIVSLSIVIPVIVIAVVIIVIIFVRKRNKKVEELLSDKNETENEKKYALMDNTN